MAATAERSQQRRRDGSYGRLVVKIRVVTQIRGTNQSILGKMTRFNDSELISRVI